MNIRQKVFQKLNNATDAGDRVYGMKAPAGTDRPYIVFYVVSDTKHKAHDGYTGLARPRVQVSCYGDTFQQVGELAEEVTELFKDWSDVSVAMHENEVDQYDEDTGLYHIPVDFFIQHKEEL